MDCFLSKQGAVYFYRGKAVKSLHNRFICHLQGLLNGFALHKLCSHTAGCHCGAAAEGFEFTVPDDSVLINIQIHSHNVSAFCIAYGSDTAGAFNLSYISRVLKMVHYFFAVHNLFSSIICLF